MWKQAEHGIWCTAGLQQGQLLFRSALPVAPLLLSPGGLSSAPTKPECRPGIFFGVSDRFKEVEQNESYSLLLRILRNQIPSAPFLGWGLSWLLWAYL